MRATELEHLAELEEELLDSGHGLAVDSYPTPEFEVGIPSRIPRGRCTPIAKRVGKFNCSNAEIAEIRKHLGQPTVTASALRAAVEAASGRAVSLAKRAAAALDRSKRTPKSRRIFCEAFGVAPEFVPPWRASLSGVVRWKDLGELVSIRLRDVVKILDGGCIHYFCWGSQAHCPECPGSPTGYFACSSFRGAYLICLGGPFWRAWQAGDTATTASTLLHEALHIYFGTTVSHRGRSSNANCYERFVLRLHGRFLHPATSSACPAGSCGSLGAARNTEISFVSEDGLDLEETLELARFFCSRETNSKLPAKRLARRIADCVSAAPERGTLPGDVQGWILSTDRSAIELVADTVLRNELLKMDWSKESFNGKKGIALSSAMARVVPERRVPRCLRYRPNIKDIVVRVPGEPKSTEKGCRPYKMLHPDAVDAFVRMREAAAKDGVSVRLLSGCRTAWRTIEEQEALAKKNKDPAAVAQGIGAHVYGLAVDIRLGIPHELEVSEASTKAGMANIVRMYRSPVYKWLALYGAKHGWFPYRREPWHWEYNPPGFKDRYEAGADKNRETEFEEEIELEGEFEDEAQESEFLFPSRSDDKAMAHGRRRVQAAGVGRWLTPFTSSAIPKYRGGDGKLRSTACSVYTPNAAQEQTAIDLLVFFHGDPGPCSQFDPDPRKTGLKFELDLQIDRSGRKVALAVPVIHWIRGTSENVKGSWSAENLNRFVEEVLDEIGRQSGVKPALRRLIITGHSHAFAILTPLAREFAQDSPATKKGALAKLKDVWALDSTYGTDGTNARSLDRWARKIPNGRIIAVLNKQYGGKRYKTPIDGWTAYLKTVSRGLGLPPNLKMCKVEETHCVIPAKYIGQLLSATSYPPSWCST
jgi:hypothetical protein